MAVLRFMQLWLWANVKMGSKGLGFAGNARWRSDGEETNIVDMKPDMAHESPCGALSMARRVFAGCGRIPMVSTGIRRGRNVPTHNGKATAAGVQVISG